MDRPEGWALLLLLCAGLGLSCAFGTAYATCDERCAPWPGALLREVTGPRCVCIVGEELRLPRRR